MGPPLSTHAQRTILRRRQGITTDHALRGLAIVGGVKGSPRSRVTLEHSEILHNRILGWVPSSPGSTGVSASATPRRRRRPLDWFACLEAPRYRYRLFSYSQAVFWITRTDRREPIMKDWAGILRPRSHSGFGRLDRPRWRASAVQPTGDGEC